MWAPSDGVLARVAFPRIHTLDSSQTPRRAEHPGAPRAPASSHGRVMSWMIVYGVRSAAGVV